MDSTFKSLKGKVLLDGGQLGGSIFHRSVVLMCQHSAEGAFGLILNKPSHNLARDVVKARLPESLQGAIVHAGGPVQTGALSYLHTDAVVLDGNVMAGLSLGHSLESLVELGESFSPTKKIRLFAGYSGWGAGQLESELERNAWIVLPASIDFVFQDNPSDLWRELLRADGDWKHRLLADAPDDYSSN